MRWSLASVSVLSLVVACDSQPMRGKDAGGQEAGTPARNDDSGTVLGTESSDTALPGSADPDTAPACPSNSICFKDGRAQGLMSGTAWARIAEQDTFESPTCGAKHDAIDYHHPCAADFEWPAGDQLCTRGRIQALPNVPIQTSVDNWGVSLGVNAAEPNGSVGATFASYKSVTFSFTGEPKSGLRAIIHRRGDPAWVTYCYDAIRLDKSLALNKFNTKCWGDDSAVYLAPEDLANIDEIGLLISSTISDINFDLCLTRITFQ